MFEKKLMSTNLTENTTFCWKWNKCMIRKKLEKLLPEIGFIEEIKSTWGNEEMPQILFHYSPYLQK